MIIHKYGGSVLVSMGALSVGVCPMRVVSADRQRNLITVIMASTNALLSADLSMWHFLISCPARFTNEPRLEI